MYIFFLISAILWGAVCGALFDRFTPMALAIIVGNVLLYTLYQALS